MTQDELLLQLMQRLDEPAARYNELDLYYRGQQPLAFLSPEAKTALGNRFGVMASNVPRLAVTALAERLRITGFTGDADLWADWIRNDLDQTSGVAHREALLLGDSYVIVWADQFGRPKVTVESPKQVAVQTDPGTRQIVAAVKRWETKTTTEAVLYLPDKIVRLRANQTGATTQGYHTVDTIANPLGVVPVVALRNSDRILGDYGCSEIDDLKPLVDALNKSLADMMVTSEYVGRPRRWATGIELTEEPVLDDDGNPVLDDGEPVMTEVNPIPEGHRAMISENNEAKFGQLNAADLAGYEASVRVILGQIMAVSTLPAHYVGVFTDNPASADALRAAEASLTARAEARQATFGRAWEQVARLMIAVRDGRDPNMIDDIRVMWADAATRSVAQEADAVVKLYAAGLLPASYALGKLGYSDDESPRFVPQEQKTPQQRRRLRPNPIRVPMSDTDTTESTTLVATEVERSENRLWSTVQQLTPRTPTRTPPTTRPTRSRGPTWSGCAANRPATANGPTPPTPTPSGCTPSWSAPPANSPTRPTSHSTRTISTTPAPWPPPSMTSSPASHTSRADVRLVTSGKEPCRGAGLVSISPPCYDRERNSLPANSSEHRHHSLSLLTFVIPPRWAEAVSVRGASLWIALTHDH